MISNLIETLRKEIPDQAATQDLLGLVEDSYKMLNNETFKQFAELAVPPQISGIDLEMVAGILNSQALRINVADWDSPPKIVNSNEPGVPVGSGSSSSVWGARYNGSYIEIHAGGENDQEFINIQHHTGTRITLDQNGAVTIKGVGKSYVGSTGDVELTAEGHILNATQNGYTIEVTNGHVNINAAGDINLNSNGSINMNAATDVKINAGSSIDVAAKGRIGMMAAVDNVDISAGKNLKLGAIAGHVSVLSKGGNIHNEAAGGIFTTADGNITTYASGELGLKGSTVYVKGGGNIHLNDGDVEKPSEGPDVEPAKIGVEPPEAKVVSPADPVDVSGADSFEDSSVAADDEASGDNS